MDKRKDVCMKPMLACNYDPEKLVFPLIASPKLDGVRALVVDGVVLSRSLKPIPNIYIQSLLGSVEYNGFDGELIVGNPTDLLCYNHTVSAVMSQDKTGFDFTYHVFDLWDSTAGYALREHHLFDLLNRAPSYAVIQHTRKLIHCEEELLAYELEVLGQGYEGLILRKPDGEYKFGRSTAKEGLLLKVKRFADGEATILGFEEQMQNNNEQSEDNLGHSKRSSHQENLTPKGTLGALLVKDVVTGVVFNIGTGMDNALRQEIWDNRTRWVGLVVKYKHFPVGAIDKPRHPVYLGVRSPIDQ